MKSWLPCFARPLLCHLQTKIYGSGKLPNKVCHCLTTVVHPDKKGLCWNGPGQLLVIITGVSLCIYIYQNWKLWNIKKWLVIVHCNFVEAQNVRNILSLIWEQWSSTASRWDLQTLSSVFVGIGTGVYPTVSIGRDWAYAKEGKV